MVSGNTMAALDILQNMALIGATSTVSGGRIMRVNMGVTAMRQNMTLVAVNIMVGAITNEEVPVRAAASGLFSPAANKTESRKVGINVYARNRRTGMNDVYKQD